MTLPHGNHQRHASVDDDAIETPDLLTRGLQNSADLRPRLASLPSPLQPTGTTAGSPGYCTVWNTAHSPWIARANITPGHRPPTPSGTDSPARTFVEALHIAAIMTLRVARPALG